jgi:regulator of cell morphogenesis and NO signaling
VEAELANATQKEAKGAVLDFQRWEPDFLADYIYNQHHVYYYEEGPIIGDLAEKVAGHHGQHVPALQQVYLIYRTLQDELKEHFLKEERILFPFIKALVKAKRTGDRNDLQALPSITQPVRMMELDHDAAGELLSQLRYLTNDYTPPQGACNSVQLLFYKLSHLEADLHQHIHLENNILFPKALKLEKEVCA